MGGPCLVIKGHKIALKEPVSHELLLEGNGSMSGTVVA